MSLQCLLHRDLRVVEAEFPAREIDRDYDRIDLRVLPALESAAHLVDYPAVDVDDQSGAFGKRDEIRGRNHSVLAVPPSDQRLGTRQHAGKQIELRLKLNAELVAFDCVPQRAFELERIARR